MKRRRERKCLHCLALFHPDPHNVRHQQYCSEIACRKVSKAASQRRWLSKEANKNYFCGPENVERVQVWRQTHPGYWRSSGGRTGSALQDDIVEMGRRLIGLGDDILNTPGGRYVNQTCNMPGTGPPDPRSVSWIDQRLVRDNLIASCGCGADALVLYLFLVTVADAQGLSYYSDQSIVRRLAFFNLARLT